MQTKRFQVVTLLRVGGYSLIICAPVTSKKSAFVKQGVPKGQHCSPIQLTWPIFNQCGYKFGNPPILSV